jgi:hypothetical protein
MLGSIMSIIFQAKNTPPRIGKFFASKSFASMLAPAKSHDICVNTSALYLAENVDIYNEQDIGDIGSDGLVEVEPLDIGISQLDELVALSIKEDFQSLRWCVLKCVSSNSYDPIKTPKGEIRMFTDVDELRAYTEQYNLENFRTYPAKINLTNRLLTLFHKDNFINYFQVSF